MVVQQAYSLGARPVDYNTTRGIVMFALFKVEEQINTYVCIQFGIAIWGVRLRERLLPDRGGRHPALNRLCFWVNKVVTRGVLACRSHGKWMGVLLWVAECVLRCKRVVQRDRNVMATYTERALRSGLIECELSYASLLVKVWFGTKSARLW